MNTETQLWLFAMSVGASALGGMLGMASGIFIVPILTIFGHVGIRSAMILRSCREALDRPRVRGDWIRVIRIAHSAATSPIGWSAFRLA